MIIKLDYKVLSDYFTPVVPRQYLYEIKLKRLQKNDTKLIISF